MPKKLPGMTVTVACTLPGFEDLSATYDVSQPYEKIKAVQNEPEKLFKYVRLTVSGWDYEDEVEEEYEDEAGDTQTRTVTKALDAPGAEHGRRRARAARNVAGR
jgi:hypothetical protein